MEKRLYFVIHPVGALIASQLNPEEFANHYKFGSSKHYEGKLIFVEIDIEYRNPYFKLDEILKDVKPHENGRPKATKFIKTYRVLEHIKFSAFKNLYLVSADGNCLELQQKKLDPTRDAELIRLYAEINPLRMLTLSSLNYQEFGIHITSDSRKNAPVVCYAQLEIDTNSFLSRIQENPMINSPISGLHPMKLKSAIEEIKNIPTKKTKGLSLNTTFDSVSFKLIRHGIMFSNSKETILYGMPSLREIEDKNIKFWKSM